jgi:hypothetical protein
MKSLIVKLAIPLTVISFATVTKWWYALPVDAPDTMFTGFPLAFTCRGWHTSLSLQFFVIEFFVDLLTYFLIWQFLIFCIDRFIIKLKPHKIMTICLWALSGLLIVLAVLMASNKDNLFYTKRPFDIEVMKTGCKFIWQNIEQPDFYQYHPKN